MFSIIYYYIKRKVYFYRLYMDIVFIIFCRVVKDVIFIDMYFLEMMIIYVKSFIMVFEWKDIVCDVFTEEVLCWGGECLVVEFVFVFVDKVVLEVKDFGVLDVNVNDRLWRKIEDFKVVVFDYIVVDEEGGINFVYVLVEDGFVFIVCNYYLFKAVFYCIICN